LTLESHTPICVDDLPIVLLKASAPKIGVSDLDSQRPEDWIPGLSPQKAGAVPEAVADGNSGCPSHAQTINCRPEVAVFLRVFRSVAQPSKLENKSFR
jgi:hypothetical protein